MQNNNNKKILDLVMGNEENLREYKSQSNQKWIPPPLLHATRVEIPETHKTIDQWTEKT